MYIAVFILLPKVSGQIFSLFGCRDLTPTDEQLQAPGVGVTEDEVRA